MEIVGVIPARFASTRLPGKPLLSQTGRPLIAHVIEAARRAKSLERILVATDDPRIAKAVQDCGGESFMTHPDHPTGTDRVAEVAAQIDSARIIVNLQGDEPEIQGSTIDRLVALITANPAIPMATLATPIHDPVLHRDPSCVKVVLDHRGRALYFSRAPIPHTRDPENQPPGPIGHLHLGVYAYRRDFLLQLAALPQAPLESREKLEQLRVLEAGHPIAVAIVDEPHVGIDTPEDYARFVERYRSAQPHP